MGALRNNRHISELHHFKTGKRWFKTLSHTILYFHTHHFAISARKKQKLFCSFSNFQAATSKQERTQTNTEILDHYSRIRLNDLAPVVQKLDDAIPEINLYPLDSAIGFPNTYPRPSAAMSEEKCLPVAG